MGLIEELLEVGRRLRGSSSIKAISDACEGFGIQCDIVCCVSYGDGLSDVFAKIAERIKQEYVPVPLDAEGEPVECLCGYFGADGRLESVVGYRSARAVVVADEYAGYRLVPAETLTKNPPDTQKRIDADKRKSVSQYWGCGGAGCHQCPSKIDGLTPCERYGMDECEVAMGYDLALRQMKLDGRA